MPRHVEMLDQGLWTAADPGVLEPGQLSDARNLIYVAGSKALVRSPGRDVFGTVSATATNVAGLRDLQFDNGDHYLIAMASNLYKYATIGDTGTFTTLDTLGAAPTTLESAHFRNRFYLMNGTSATATNGTPIGTNRVAYLSATGVGTAPSMRQHGMIPVRNAPVTALSAANFALNVSGYYEYWTTEVAKFTQDGAEFLMESTFDSAPATVLVNSTASAAVITRPEIQNVGVTTHWRTYRSARKDTESGKEFPSGFMISEVATATARVVDTLTPQTVGYVFPATFNSSGPFSGFTTPGSLAADDAAYASATTVVGGGFGVSPSVAQGCYGFTFGGFSGTILGIEVELQGYVSVGSAPVTVGVSIGPRQSDGGFRTTVTQVGWSVVFKTTSASKNCVIASTNSASPTTVVLGGATDRWFPPNETGLRDSDFDSNFMVVLSVAQTAVRSIGFDYVKVKVYYGGALTSTAIQFPAVVYTFGDVTAEVGKNGMPPSSTTGDFYEDQLVVNDVTNPALVRFSYPGDPDAFPETYFIDMETAQNDVVRAIKTVNERLVVLCHNSSWRLNYLPSERDSSFDRGKSKAPISATYGCIHAMCAAVFSPGGGTDLLAYVSHHGIHATDGFSFETYTEGLNWDQIMRPGSSTPIALINDRARSLLLYYFQNTADYGSETYLCLPLAYGEGHWQGRPKVCGLTHMRNHSAGNFASLHAAWAAQRQNGKVSVYMGYGGSVESVGAGKVYIETGTTMPALDPRAQYTTREMYLAGYGNEWRLGEVYGYAHSYGATTPALSYAVSTRKTNDTALVARSTKSITLAGQKLHKAGVANVMCEAASITMVATASAFAEEFLVLDGEGFGLEHSGR